MPPWPPWISGRLRKKKKPVDEVRQARIITLVVGLAVMMGALSLENFTGSDDILTILPKTFNALVGPMGGLFLAGMFLPRAGRRTVWPAAIIGFLTSLAVAYSQPLLQSLGPSAQQTLVSLLGDSFGPRLIEKGMGFTWIMPTSFVASFGTAWILSLIFPNRNQHRLAGLTWKTRHEKTWLTS